MASEDTGGSVGSEGGVPHCPSGEGHSWVSGRARIEDGQLIEMLSRQCRRCGYEDVFDEEGDDG